MVSLITGALMQMLLLEAGRAADNPPIGEFYLDTRAISGYRMSVNTLARDVEVMDRSAPLKMIIHGWTEDANRTNYKHLSRAFLQNATCNIIRVDYSTIARQNYIWAVAGVESVGNFVGDFLSALVMRHSIPIGNVHVVGHSLGAQVAGYVGRRVVKVLGMKLHHITGLDPASPLFELNDDKRKLTSRDADIVDIIHTDAGVLGYAAQFGTVDFMPNGGVSNQPTCSGSNASKLCCLLKVRKVCCLSDLQPSKVLHFLYGFRVDGHLSAQMRLMERVPKWVL